MSMIPREVIRELIKERKFESANDIMEAIKEMFADVLEEVLQGELDAKLGYDKQERRISSGYRQEFFANLNLPFGNR